MRILVVDDETIIVKGIKFNLENDGYEVDTAYDGEEAMEKIRAVEYDAILLDLMLPKIDGLEVCRMVREFSNVPIIMLTAKSEDIDKLIGFEYGADDYVTKPFNVMEIKARVRAVLRRTASGDRRDSGAQNIIRGAVELNPLERRVEVDGREVMLTAKEFDVLELLMKNAGHVYSRDALMKALWGESSQADARTVDVHIHHLREKLERNAAEPEFILTKWGVGYYFKQ